MLRWLDLRRMYTWMLKCSNAHVLVCSHAHMSTCFNDHLLTCLVSLMITCSYIHVLWWSHTSIFTCFDVHILHIYLPWWSYATISTSFDDHMPTFMYALMLICLDCSMITCSHYVCTNSHVFLHTWFLTCLHALIYYSLMLTCLDDHMLICFDEQMLPRSMPWSPWSSHAYMLRWLHSPMLTFININMFDICMHVHIVRWWYVYIYL